MSEVDLQNLVLTFQQHYSNIVSHLEAQVTGCWPRFSNYNNFDRFLLLNIFILMIYIVLTCLADFSPKRIYLTIVKWIFLLPPIKNKLNAQIAKMKEEVAKEHVKPKYCQLPWKTPQHIKVPDTSDLLSLQGKTSGSRYALKKHCDFVVNLAKSFSYANPMHSSMFPCVKQMEIEVIEITASILNFKTSEKQTCGTFNSGGSESIIMALLAYREHGMKQRGVLRPNLVICSTGHVAAHKACSYFDIEVRVVKFDKEYRMDLSDMKKHIDSNTICVYASYPNYPYGTVDPLEEIGAICKKKDIPVHVDMCLGGFVAPFLEENFKLPPGMTSISTDPHKYGLAAKGASILLYSDEKYRKSQFFVCNYWPGGLYGTQGIAGSRSGVYIASAWISLMKVGRKGYTENAKILRQSTLRLAKELRDLDFNVFGQPSLSVIAFNHKVYPVNSVQIYMKKKGWGLSLMQKPLSLHYSLTPLNCTTINELIKDLHGCYQELKKNPIAKESSEVQLYGACATIPDQGTKDKILEYVLDVFIDLE